MKTKIDVTAEDIATGKRNRCMECPVALALHRAGFHKAKVWDDWSGDLVIEDLLDGNDIVQAPTSVQKFVGSFDNGHPVEPFSFEIDV